jgi:hypothetical protein
LKRAKYLVCNIYDATLKIIAVAKVKANIVIHICSSIAWQAGARPVSQPPAPGLILVSLDGAAADDLSSMRLILKTSETFVRRPSEQFCSDCRWQRAQAARRRCCGFPPNSVRVPSGYAAKPLGTPITQARFAIEATDLAATIKELQAAGCESLRAIAAGLEDRGIPAARGGKWSAVQVARLLDRLGWA